MLQFIELNCQELSATSPSQCSKVSNIMEQSCKMDTDAKTYSRNNIQFCILKIIKRKSIHWYSTYF